MANGRPWFVRYANTAIGLTGSAFNQIGPLGVPFQPSNEPEQLLMQADPLLYKQFPTRAAAQAWIKSPAGQKDLGFGAGPGSALKTGLSSSPLSGVAAIGDFFQRLGQASTWIRVGEVLLGLILLGVGIARMTNAVPLASKVAAVAAKGAIP
jgi:hypothetical protein